MPTNFTYTVLGDQTWDPYDDNIDVEIVLTDGRKYWATFFTIPNIRALMDKNKITGECGGGMYLWSANMVILENLESETIWRTIAGLIADQEVESICCRIN